MSHTAGFSWNEGMLGVGSCKYRTEWFHCSLVVHTKCGQWAGIFHIQLQILWDPKFPEILEI